MPARGFRQATIGDIPHDSYTFDALPGIGRLLRNQVYVAVFADSFPDLSTAIARSDIDHAIILLSRGTRGRSDRHGISAIKSTCGEDWIVDSNAPHQPIKLNWTAIKDAGEFKRKLESALKQFYPHNPFQPIGFLYVCAVRHVKPAIGGGAGATTLSLAALTVAAALAPRPV